MTPSAQSFLPYEIYQKRKTQCLEFKGPLFMKLELLVLYQILVLLDAQSHDLKCIIIITRIFLSFSIIDLHYSDFIQY